MDGRARNIGLRCAAAHRRRLRHEQGLLRVRPRPGSGCWVRTCDRFDERPVRDDPRSLARLRWHAALLRGGLRDDAVTHVERGLPGGRREPVAHGAAGSNLLLAGIHVAHCNAGECDRIGEVSGLVQASPGSRFRAVWLAAEPRRHRRVLDHCDVLGPGCVPVDVAVPALLLRWDGHELCVFADPRRRAEHGRGLAGVHVAGHHVGYEVQALEWHHRDCAGLPKRGVLRAGAGGGGTRARARVRCSARPGSSAIACMMQLSVAFGGRMMI
mmetsp:Transcript_76882/g.220083  ORF Transcript_76882/g.220083 Transcript_76882/m.220083 type:complete len:270 (+) Transcript_76882:1434-2243(+)